MSRHTIATGSEDTRRIGNDQTPRPHTNRKAQAMKPKRIQLSRKKGWRMPPNTVKVTRPGPWGNPFKVQPGETNYFVVSCFRDYVRENPEFAARIRKELRGKNLACFCPLDRDCHADVLLEIANA